MKQGKNSPLDYYKESKIANSYFRRRFSGRGGEYINKVELAMMVEGLPKDLKKITILDLGTGTSRLTLRLLDLGVGSVIAVDPSEQMLSFLKETKDKRLKVHVGSAEKIPIPDAQCDAVVALRLFEHFDEVNIKRFFIEINRVLKSKGLLIFNTVNSHSLEALLIKLSGYSSSKVYPISKLRMKNILKSRGFEQFKNTRDVFIVPRGFFMHLPIFVKILEFMDKILLASPLAFFASHNVWYLKKSSNIN